MANILDYITWRGDLSFKQAEFNGVDNLILSAFSYLPLDAVFFGDKKITIKQAYSRAMSIGVEENEYIQVGAKDLFSSVTIFLPDNTVYVSYRGTDATLVGWKEDFNMSFSSNIPSQDDAVKYLENITKMTKKKLRVGGHSKGGNLAIYASAFCKDNTKKQIIEVYNNDGPGMNEKVIETAQYRGILSKIHTYIPQSSVIGRLLYHEEKYTVIESIQKGLMQHDLYSWRVKGNNFICLDEVTNGSEIVNKVIKGWLSGVEARKKRRVYRCTIQGIKLHKSSRCKRINCKLVQNSRKNIKSIYWGR